MTMLDLTTVASALIAVLALALALAAYRMLSGPDYADRFIALDMLTAVVVSLAALTALDFGEAREMSAPERTKDPG